MKKKMKGPINKFSFNLILKSLNGKKNYTIIIFIKNFKLTPTILNIIFLLSVLENIN